MGIIDIKPVQREGARILIMLCGVSGCGKSYTAIQLAYGLANGNAAKVGFLDTENGRGKFYADTVQSPFLYGELKPPFSPDRYIQAIDEFAKAGVEVLILDSGTHEFEGIGGIQDIAEAGNPKIPNWNRAKAQHKRFMSALLNSPMHIILCLRAREKAKPEKQVIDGREKTVYVDLGLQPITEKNVVFEATASLMLHDQGRRQEQLKVPAALQSILGRGGDYLTEKDGRALRAWVDGAKQLDPKVEHHRGLLQMAAENGMAALVEAWGNVPKAIKPLIGQDGCPESLKESARAFDKIQAEAAEGNASPATTAAIDALNKAAANAPARTDAAPEAKSAPAAKPESPASSEQAGDDGDMF